MSGEAILALAIQIVDSTLRVSTPLLFAAMAGLLCERSGVVNVALEGLMLFGAFAGASVTLLAHSLTGGVFAAMGAGVLCAIFYAFFVIELRADQIVAGFAMNLLGAGLIPVISKILFQSTTATPSLPMELRLTSSPLFCALGIVLACAGVLRYTPFGLWVQFAGEHPEALEAAGVKVRRVRWTSVLISGALAGLGGATLSLSLSSNFTRNMTAGRGYMALAAVIFGKWRPIPTAFACLFFGLTDAIQSRLQGVVLWGTEPVPVQFIQILPYCATLIVLAGWVGRSRSPRALGVPF